MMMEFRSGLGTSPVPGEKCTVQTVPLASWMEKEEQIAWTGLPMKNTVQQSQQHSISHLCILSCDMLVRISVYQFVPTKSSMTSLHLFDKTHETPFSQLPPAK